MFKFKSKAARQAEVEAARKSVIDGFERQIDDAVKCADPVDRFLKLEECKDSIDQFIATTKETIKEASRGSFKKSYVSIAGTTTLGTTVLVLGLHFPPALLLLAYPGIFGGAAIGKKAMVKAEAAMLEDARPLFQNLESQRGKADAAADTILKNDLNQLAASPRLEEIIEKAPRIRDHFTAAFARRVAQDAEQKPQRPSGPGSLRL